MLFKYKKNLIVFLLVLSNNLFGMETRGIGRTTADLNSNVSPLSIPLYSPADSPEQSPRVLVFMTTKELALAKLAAARARIAHHIAAREEAKRVRDLTEKTKLDALVRSEQEQAEKVQKAAERYQAKHGSLVEPESPFLKRVALRAGVKFNL